MTPKYLDLNLMPELYMKTKKYGETYDPPCECHEGIILRPETVTEEYQRIRSKRVSFICSHCGWEITYGAVRDLERDPRFNIPNTVNVAS